MGFFYKPLPLSPSQTINQCIGVSCTEKTTKDIIRELSSFYGVDYNLAIRIAFCESGISPYAKNPNSSASGIYQFTKSTFIEGVEKRGLLWTWNDVFDQRKNIDMALWYISQGQLWRWDASKNCWNI